MIAPAVANHLLAREAWARERLAGHAGRTVEIGVGPFATTLAIDEGGLLAAPAQRSTPDLKLRLSPFDVPPFLADPSRWNEFVRSEGDVALAGTLAEIAHTLPLFVERAFADALGPVVGQRIADAGRTMLKLPEYAASRVADGVASYASDEARIATRGVELATFVADVERLAARTDALAERIDALAARVAQRG